MKTPRFDNIAVCVFDAYGTLLDISGVAADKIEAAFGPQARAFVDLWRRKQLEYTWLRSLMDRYDDFWHVTGESLDYAMAAFGKDDPALRADLMEAYLVPPLYPEVLDALGVLKARGMKTAILSNGSPLMLTEAVKQSGLYDLLDDVLSVDRLGVYKPHASVYRLATDRFGVAPEQVAFQTSNGWDAAGAAAFGFKVAWINRAGLPAERLPAQPAAEVKSLAELPALLGL